MTVIAIVRMPMQEAMLHLAAFVRSEEAAYGELVPMRFEADIGKGIDEAPLEGRMGSAGGKSGIFSRVEEDALG